MSDNTLTKLIHQLQKTSNGKAWHGPNVVEGLSGLSLEQATYRIGKAHNIAELVHHLYAWRVFIIKRLSGEADFEVSDDFNFITIDKTNTETWQSLKNQLNESQNDLIEAMKKFDPQQLSENVINRNYTFLDLIHGIIHHDLYHLGQIVLLKRISK